MNLHYLYIGADEEAERCREAIRLKAPVEIAGTDTLTGRPQRCSGLVLAVEAGMGKEPGERWRITIDAV